jgi:hypothetical protein
MPVVSFGSEGDSVQSVMNYRSQMLPHVAPMMRLPQASTPIRNSYAFSAGMAHHSNNAHHSDNAHHVHRHSKNDKNAVVGGMVFTPMAESGTMQALTSPF